MTAPAAVRDRGTERPVPRWADRLAHVIPLLTLLGALALIAIWTYGFRDVFSKDFIPFTNDGWAALMISCYAPLQLWGPFLLVLTWAYYQRRSGTRVSGTGRAA